MKKSLFLWQFAGFIFTSVMGTFLHFAYALSNQNPTVALFSATNESIWEHLKLLFFPMFIFALAESYFLRDEYKSFWCIKLRSFLLGLILIPAIYYTYTGAFGITYDFINISIFFLVTAFTYIREYYLFKRASATCKTYTVAFIILCMVAVVFFIFTFYPPDIPLLKAS